MMTISPLSVGEPAPWFSAATGGDHPDAVAFDELAGRYIVLFFFGTATRPDVASALTALGRRSDLFDREHALLLGISNDRDDFGQGRLRQDHCGQLFLLDASGIAAKQYGVVDPAAAVVAAAVRPVAFMLSPALQIVEIVPLADPAGFIERITSRLSEFLANPLVAQNAPVLIVPKVFDRPFCRQLVELYEATGGREIGAMENKGKVVERFDPKVQEAL